MLMLINRNCEYRRYVKFMYKHLQIQIFSRSQLDDPLLAREQRGTVIGPSNIQGRDEPEEVAICDYT